MSLPSHSHLSFNGLLNLPYLSLLHCAVSNPIISFSTIPIFPSLHRIKSHHQLFFKIIFSPFPLFHPANRFSKRRGTMKHGQKTSRKHQAKLGDRLALKWCWHGDGDIHLALSTWHPRIAEGCALIYRIDVRNFLVHSYNLILISGFS